MIKSLKTTIEKIIWKLCENNFKEIREKIRRNFKSWENFEFYFKAGLADFFFKVSEFQNFAVKEIINLSKIARFLKLVSCFTLLSQPNLTSCPGNSKYSSDYQILVEQSSRRCRHQTDFLYSQQVDK